VPQVAADNLSYGLLHEGYRRGFTLMEEDGRALEKTRHHTDEARRVVWDHACELTERACQA
jgi:hypothetical protein